MLFLINLLAMEKITAEKRDTLGKKNNALRKEGRIPAVIYNAKTESLPISIDRKDINKIASSAKTTTQIEVSIGKDKKIVLLKEISRDPRTDDILHVSFFEIVEGKSVDIEVPVQLEGVSPAVKNNIGVLVTPVTHILVRCTPSNIPEAITVDLSGLEKVGQTILIGDLELPEGVSLIHSEDEKKAVVAVTNIQKKEEVVTTTEEEVEGEEGEETQEQEEAETSAENPEAQEDSSQE